MQKKILIYLIIAFLVIGGGAWIYFQQNPGNIVLQNNLPPVPRGYDKINPDEAIAAEIPQDRKNEFMEYFDSTIKTIQEHPDSFVAWMDLGAIKNFFGDYKGTEEAWLYAVEIAPNQSRVYMGLGDLYWNKLGNIEKAEEAYIRALEREPTLISAWRDLANLYRFSYPEKRHLAIDILISGTKNNPDDRIELLALAGLWAAEDGNIEDAIAYYEEFLQINPSNEQAQLDLKNLKECGKVSECTPQ